MEKIKNLMEIYENERDDAGSTPIKELKLLTKSDI